MITVKHLIENVSIILQDMADDQAEREWPEDYLVDAYNLEARKIAAKYPDACTEIENIPLAEGIKQQIPENGIALITVMMNMDGEIPTSPVLSCTLPSMSVYSRSWMNDDPATEIINFMPDPADTTVFYCYPPSDGTGHVMAQYSIVPEQVLWDEEGLWETKRVSLAEKYISMLEKKIIERAYKKDTDIPGNIQRENISYEKAARTRQPEGL